MTALFSLDVKVEGFETVDAALARLGPENDQPLLDHIAWMIAQQARARIDSEKRGPDGKAWPPNKTGDSILLKTKALRDSITSTEGRNPAVIGSGLIYAGIHQTGGTILPKKAKRLVFRLGNKTIFARKVTIPARPYLGISAENAADILEQVAIFLRSKLGGGA